MNALYSVTACKVSHRDVVNNFAPGKLRPAPGTSILF